MRPILALASALTLSCAARHSATKDYQGVELFRRYRNKLAPVEVDIRDHETLRVPLLPGDVITWR